MQSDGIIAATELDKTKNQMQTDEAEYRVAQFGCIVEQTNCKLFSNCSSLQWVNLPHVPCQIRNLLQNSYANQAVSTTVRVAKFEFEVPNPARELKAGSYAEVKLHISRKKGSIMVPVSAKVTTLEKRFIIKVSGNTTQWIDVRPGFKPISKPMVRRSKRNLIQLAIL